MASKSSLSRRDFLVGSAATVAAMSFPSGVFAQGSSQIKVGVIGCGGRGTGAAIDAANADPNVVIWAMGDLFEDRLNSSRNTIKDHLKGRAVLAQDEPERRTWSLGAFDEPLHGPRAALSVGTANHDRYAVADERAFVGWDAYKRVLETDCDYVILATPPGFRPIHLRAAVEANKNIFTEKPVATDAPGIRSVLETYALSQSKGLQIAAGTQRRHDPAYRECIKRIHDGQMGDVVASYAYWNQGGLWSVKQTPQMSDMEWQVRNWLYFTWISGDIIVEQHIHNIDVCMWAHNAHPVKAICLAGREVRKDPIYGHIFDHFATEFEYANGTKTISMCRQIDGTASRVAEHIVGTKGTSDANNWINGPKKFEYTAKRINPYVEEHKNLIAAIRGKGKINELKQVAETNLAAIMGRMAGYTGSQVTWEQALNSQESLFPSKLEFGPLAVMSVATPGVTKLS